MMIGHHCVLTRREQQVSRLVLFGRTSRIIGELLSMSRSTVDTHIDNIKRKLGARNRAHMAALLIVKELVSVTVEDLEESIIFED